MVNGIVPVTTGDRPHRRGDGSADTLSSMTLRMSSLPPVHTLVPAS